MTAWPAIMVVPGSASRADMDTGYDPCRVHSLLRHTLEAIDRLDPGRAHATLQALRAQLHTFRADEVDHRDDAAARFDRPAGPAPLLLRLWLWAVGAGSRGAVKICHWV